MESLKEAMKQFAKYVTITAGVYVAVIVIFTYHVLLDKDLPCTCKGQVTDCWLYLLLPWFIIFVLMLWTDKRFQRASKYTCRYSKANLCCVLVYRTLKASFVGLLWVLSVFIDGDWYVCCQNDQHPQLACKSTITAEDRVNINELVNKSRFIGLIVLGCVTGVAAILPLIQWNKCCPVKKCCGAIKCCTVDECWTSIKYCCASKCCGDDSQQSNRSVHFDEIILEEGEDLVLKMLRKTAAEELREKLKGHIRNKDWGKCFAVSEEVMIELNRPGQLDQEEGGQQDQEEGGQQDQPQNLEQAMLTSLLPALSQQLGGQRGGQLDQQNEQVQEIPDTDPLIPKAVCELS